MKQFTLAISSILLLTYAQTYQMEAKPLMTFSNFSGSMIDRSFRMPRENNNLLWMDLSMLFEEASMEEIELHREVQKHKSRLKKYNRNKDKFSARKKRLGVND